VFVDVRSGGGSVGVEVGVEAVEAFVNVFLSGGYAPSGLWIPECGFR
jgi:hypothetical protein